MYALEGISESASLMGYNPAIRPYIFTLIDSFIYQFIHLQQSLSSQGHDWFWAYPGTLS